jgi:hypothetical protein
MDYDGFWTKGKIIFFSVCAVVLIIAGSIGGPILSNWINASTAPVISKQQEKQQVYTPQNRISQYNLSYNELATYKSNLESVSSNWTTLNTFDKEYTPADIAANATGTLAELQQQDQAAVTGTQQICTQSAEQYNADAAKIDTGAAFRGVNLPKTVSIPACEKGNPNG